MQRHSTGPTSKEGKAQSARNALKHGIFTKELFLSEEEKPEFEDLSNALRSQFKPATPMQEIAFGRVACSCWRCRLATRLEMSRIKKYLDLDLAEGRTGQSTPEARPPSRCYRSSRSELLAARRYFADLRDDIADERVLSPRRMEGPTGQSLWEPGILRFADAVKTGGDDQRHPDVRGIIS